MTEESPTTVTLSDAMTIGFGDGRFMLSGKNAHGQTIVTGQLIKKHSEDLYETKQGVLYRIESWVSPNLDG
jgi:hypothetical protein